MALPLTSSSQGPKLQHLKLNNGTQCVLAEMPDATLTCLDFWCKAGSAFEQSGEEGIAHFLEHMIFKGSNQIKAGEFDLRIEALGGSSNAATGFDDVHYHVLVPPDSVETALDLLLNLVLKPSLYPEAFLMEREVVLEEIAQYEDQPEEQVLQHLLKGCFIDHPYSKPILGYSSSLKESNHKIMRGFHERLYTGHNCCLAIAGMFQKKLKSKISEGPLGRIKCTEEIANNSKEVNSLLQFRKGREEITIPRLESARLLMAWPLPPAKNQDFIMGADIATSILSDGRCSRLIKHLREELQIVESVDMEITVLEKVSLVILEACCIESNIDQVEKEIKKVLVKCLEEPIPLEELNRAKKLIKNGFYFNLECSSQVANLIGNQTLWGRQQPLLHPLTYIDNWSENRIREELFSVLQSDSSFTLIAMPKLAA